MTLNLTPAAEAFSASITASDLSSTAEQSDQRSQKDPPSGGTAAPHGAVTCSDNSFLTTDTLLTHSFWIALCFGFIVYNFLETKIKFFQFWGSEDTTDQTHRGKDLYRFNQDTILQMFCSRRGVEQWYFTVFLLCSPAPHYGGPVDALTSRMKRSVTHAQLMHDKGRVLQDFKRRMWLQVLLDEVHTAELRELLVHTAVSTGPEAGLGLPGANVEVSLGLDTPNPHPKPPGGTKNLPIPFHLEDEEGTNLPQETNKSQIYGKDGALKEGGKSGGRKKKGRNGRRREGEKRKRRARSLEWTLKWEEPGSGSNQEWRGSSYGLH
ncbi:hypothetical protein UPYG_G00274190 [Umbra pygmaea]|uniref:Uncharacterized protein n=1 Tax=Umbra pygmaea TaxID=75934 RepID=A0ABD0W1Z4_UMBPY